MKKPMAITLAMLLLLSIISGCSSPKNVNKPREDSKSNQEDIQNSQEPEDTFLANLSISDEELNLYTFPEAFPQKMIDNFTEKTGVKVNYLTFNTNEDMLAQLKETKGGEYDLIIADDYMIEKTIQAGLVKTLDQERLSNRKHINPIYQGQYFDPQDAYTVPHGAGIQTIVYNPNLVDFSIKGYTDLWNKALKDQVGIIGNYRVINGMALKVMGESYNTTDTNAIEAAGRKLLTLAPNLHYVENEPLEESLISGKIGAAIMYTSQVTKACLANPELKVVYPKEGLGFGVMAQFIPLNAPHPDAAYAFMDYLLRPDVAKQCFEYSGYYNTNKGADEIIDPQYLDYIILPEGFTRNMEMIQSISDEAEAAHQKVWEEFVKVWLQ